MGKYNVDIYVSDNCSSDDTESVVNALAENYPFIHYSRNPENLGYDRNVASVLSMCNNKYVWLMGDDDTLTKGIEDILHILQDEQPDILYLDDSGTSYHKPKQLYTDAQTILEELAFNLTWLSSWIYSREKILTGAKYDKYFGTGFVHVGIALDEFFEHGGTMCYLAEGHVVPMFAVVYHESSGRYFESWYVGMLELILRLPRMDYYKKAAWLRSLGYTAKNVLINAVKARSFGYFSKNDIDRWIWYSEPFGVHVPRAALRIIASIPVGLLKSFHGIYRKRQNKELQKQQLL